MVRSFSASFLLPFPSTPPPPPSKVGSFTPVPMSVQIMRSEGQRLGRSTVHVNPVMSPNNIRPKALFMLQSDRVGGFGLHGRSPLSVGVGFVCTHSLCHHQSVHSFDPLACMRTRAPSRPSKDTACCFIPPARCEHQCFR